MELNAVPISLRHLVVVIVMSTCIRPLVVSVDLISKAKSVGFCRGNNNCNCLHSKKSYSFVICEGLLYLTTYIDRRSKILKLACHSNEVNEFHEHISLLEWDLEEKPANKIVSEMSLIVENCSMPIRGYASQFHPINANSSVSIYNKLPLTKLNIYCVSILDYSITKSSLAGLDKLEELIIHCPSLLTLPPDLFGHVKDSLRTLRITNTRIESIPRELFHNMSKLEKMDLSNNSIEHVAGDSFVGTNILEELLLQKNKIERLEEDLFSNLRSLRNLDVSHNNISDLPECRGNLTQMIAFRASDNRIERIPAAIFDGMTSLGFIHLSRNRISYIHPGTFSNLKELHTLYMDRNRLGYALSDYSNRLISIDHGPTLTLASDNTNAVFEPLSEHLFSGNPILENLDLSNNYITSLPQKLFVNNEKLRWFGLESNALTFLPEQLLKYNHEIFSLDLSSNSLKELPREFGYSFNILWSLNLSNNRLKSLDEDIFSNATRLRELFVYNNSLVTLPFKIFTPSNRTLDSLKKVDLSDNLLSSLPLLNLPEVTHLNLAKNNLTVIANETFHRMGKLQHLNISYNFISKIESIPLYLGSQDLVGIDMSHNLLDGIDPEWFPKNKLDKMSLKSFNFSGNKLAELIHGGIESKSAWILEIEELDLSRSQMERFYDMEEVEPPYKSFVLNIFDKKLLSVKTLDLSHNRLRMETCAFEWDKVRKTWGCNSVLRYLTWLEELKLSHNLIEVLPLDLRMELPHLRYVDLRYNRIAHLGHQDFLVSKGIIRNILLRHLDAQYHLKDWKFEEYSTSHKLLVDLRYNLIESVDLRTAFLERVPRVCWKDDLFGHATYLLGHNPFVCDCQLFDVLRYAAKEVRPTGELERTTGKMLVLPANIDIEHLKCSKPASVEGNPLSEPDTWTHHILPLYMICDATSE